MIEPTRALQATIQAALVASPAVAALVPADRIHAGSTRPDELPCIRISDGDCVMFDHAPGNQFAASVALDLHIWTMAGGMDEAKTIGAAVARVLMDWPHTDDFIICKFKHVSTVWPRDPKSDFGHGVLSVEAVIQWRL